METKETPKRIFFITSLKEHFIRDTEIALFVLFIFIAEISTITYVYGFSGSNVCSDKTCPETENCTQDCTTETIERKKEEKMEQSSTEKDSVRKIIEEKNIENSYVVKFKDPSYSEKEVDLKAKEEKQEITSQKKLEQLNKYSSEIKTKQKKYKLKVQSFNKKIELKHEYKFSMNGLTIKNVTNDDIEKIKKLDYVESVEPDKEYTVSLLDSVGIIGANTAWTNGYDGSNIKVAVIDSGIDYVHPDLGGCFGSDCKVVDGYDFVNSDNDPMDDSGHGTHVAGIIAANGAVKGVAYNSKLYAYKVCNFNGKCKQSSILAALDKALDPNGDGDTNDHVNIINISLGGIGNPDDIVSLAVDTVVNAGIVVAAAAGNDGPEKNTVGSPGTARNAITVGAIDKSGNIASFSSRGPTSMGSMKPDIVAPGIDICSSKLTTLASENTCVDSDHLQSSGTSMATPHVAGAAALILQAHPDWAPNQIKYALRNTASENYGSIFDAGLGKINIDDAINLTQKPLIGIIETYGKKNGTIEIKGKIEADQLNNYSLEIGKGENPNDWQTLVNSTTYDNSNLLTNFDTSLYEDSIYTLRLKVTSGENDALFSSYDYALITIDNINISSPLAGSLDTSGKLSVIGNAYGTNFTGYRLEYSPHNSNQWTEIKSSSEQIKNDTLGIWDYSSLSAGEYDLRLSTTNSDNRMETDLKNVFIDTSLASGWPMDIPVVFAEKVSNVNISGSGERNFAAIFRNFNIYPFSANLYLISPNKSYDKTLYENTFFESTYAQEGLSVAQMDDTYGEEIQFKENSRLHNLNRYDSNINGWPVQYAGVTTAGAQSSSDIDSDGQNEVILIQNEKYSDDNTAKAYVYKRDGTLMSGWPTPMGSEYVSSVAVGDINNDGYKEIVIEQYNQNSPSTFFHHKISIKDYKGDDVSGWPKEFPDTISTSSLVLGDVAGDKGLEIITVDTLINTKETVVRVYDASGNMVSNWPQKLETTYYYKKPIALGDFDNDGKAEIVTTSRDKIHILKGDGTEFSSNWPQNLLPFNDSNLEISSLLLADINNDQNPEILAYCRPQWFLNSKSSDHVTYIGAWALNGTFLKKWTMPGAPDDMFQLFDFNHNGTLDLLATTTIINQSDAENSSSADIITGSKIFFWDLNTPLNPKATPWPMEKRNPGLDSAYPASETIFCGNGVCEKGEDGKSCGDDCISRKSSTEYVCSSCSNGNCDGICNILKEKSPCRDCVPDYSCGDGFCAIWAENKTNCNIDCGCKSDAVCNDLKKCTVDTCNTNYGTCSNVWPVCGISDGCCSASCTADTDPDCPSCDKCQDGVCNKICNIFKENSSCLDCSK